MKRSELAKQLSLSSAQIDALINQLASEGAQIDTLADDIPDNLAQALIAQKQQQQPALNQQETALEPTSKTKRTRGGKLAKKASEQLEQTAQAQSVQGLTQEEHYLRLKAFEGAVLGKKAAAVYWHTAIASEAESHVQQLSSISDALTHLNRTGANDFDPEQFLAKIGIQSAGQSLGNVQNFRVNLSDLEEITESLNLPNLLSESAA